MTAALGRPGRGVGFALAVSGYRACQRDGSLRLASVVSSGGVLPVSVAVHGSLVYVANAGPADSNYTGFRLAPWGTLTPGQGRR
jgi:hypothetical protein